MGRLTSDFKNDLHWDLVVTSPERYESGDLGWAVNGDAGKTIRRKIKGPEAIELIVHQQVVDGRAYLRHQANKFLLQLGANKEWPEEFPTWTGGLPLVVGDEHVLLRAVTPHDLDVWAGEQRRAADLQYATVLMACDGAEWAARSMRRRGWGVMPLPEVVR